MPYPVRKTADVCYGEASVGYTADDAGATTRSRPLLLDVYQPVGVPDEVAALGLPAVVMAFGGAYHRGSKEADEFEEGQHWNTPVSTYCEMFAAAGYVAFSIDYRLVTELPAPTVPPIKRDRRQVGRERLDVVRQILGLPPATHDEILHGIEAAWSDMATAVRFVHRQAARWQVDPARITAGGFSAGAISAMYAAYALAVPVNALIVISGRMAPDDVAYYLAEAVNKPPLISFAGSDDLAGIASGLHEMKAHSDRIGLRHQHYDVPGSTHFYPSDRAVVSWGGETPAGRTVAGAIADFLATGAGRRVASTGADLREK